MSGTIAFITMGCAKNEADTSNMAQALVKSGFSVTDDVKAADMVVVNTCSFIQDATEESIAAILEASELPNVAAGAKLVVAGCMPARYGSELETELPEVAAFIPCSSESDIAKVATELLGLPDAEREHGNFEQSHESSLAGHKGGLFAYVKISDGCDRWCSYCTIPKIRGRYHSFPKQQIFAEVKRAEARGAKEVVLVAQDTGRWGSDLEEPDTLAELLCSLADDFPEMLFRAMYIQPEGVSNELLCAIASKPNICNYLDIPIQHVSPHILKDMNRSGTADEFLALFSHIADKVPKIALRTTLIAGFPGETEEDLQELIDFIESSPLDYIGIFPYSREEGTKAYKLPGQLDEEEKAYRAALLRDIADSVCAANISARIGSKAQVLVEGCEEDGQVFGRSEWQAPEVDGITFVDEGQPGDVIEVVIEDTLFYDMEGSTDYGA